jgi:hypothetical protein
MQLRRAWRHRGVILLSFYTFFLFLCLPTRSPAFTQADRLRFQKSIIDHRPRINHNYPKIKRKHTKYIIVHTSELGLKATLRVVSKGKRFRNGRRTHGGHCHYVIARDGRTYRILDKRYIADHAGLSMWNGETNLSRISIGIELVGYHYAPITERQYRAIGLLIELLQGVYNLDDKAVLTHSQIAYGRPNRWVKKKHRGRKRCAKNFVRSKAQLGPTWPHDPDVVAKRLVADAQLSERYYGSQRIKTPGEEANVISKKNTAWVIAGEDFNSSTTVYKFPDGRLVTGAQIDAKNGWDRIPAKTVVLLNQEIKAGLMKNDGPVKTISGGMTAWSLAGKSYNSKSTIYFLPSGHIKTGAAISDWDDLPLKTRLIIGYKGPYKLGRGQSALHIAGKIYKDPKTIYFFPSKKIFLGNEIDNFKRLKAGTLIFIPATS